MTSKELFDTLKVEVRENFKNYHDVIFSDGIFAYLAGRFPDLPMSKAFEVVGDLRDDYLTVNVYTL